MRKIKNSIDSVPFTDGIVYLFPLTKTGEPDRDKSVRLKFGERSMTIKRVLEAKQIQANYSRVIGVPLISPGRIGRLSCAEISGRMYRIENVQEIYSTIPSMAVVALSDWEIKRRI